MEVLHTNVLACGELLKVMERGCGTTNLVFRKMSVVAVCSIDSRRKR